MVVRVLIPAQTYNVVNFPSFQDSFVAEYAA